VGMWCEARLWYHVENGGSVVAPLGSRLTCYIGREHPRRGL
jgi:hypothetical protein